MLKLREQVKVYFYPQHIDFRKSINGLSAIVIENGIDNPASGNLFIFYNKHRDKVKLLFWDRNGFVMYYKCLHKSKFKIPKSFETTTEITQGQLDWLLAGLDFITMNQFNELNYCNYY